MSASPHEYIATVEGVCALCGQRREATMHQTVIPASEEPVMEPRAALAYLLDILGGLVRDLGDTLVALSAKVEGKE